MFILQTTTFQIDPDSLAAKKAQITDVLLNTPPGELMHLLGQQAVQFGLKVLAAQVIYGLGAWIISLVRKAVRRSFRRRETEATVATFMDSLVAVILWIVLIVVTISALGVNTTSIAALLAAGGMAIGMALGGTVQNFAGGVMLLVFKPFKVGDFIEAQGFAGFVEELTIVSTKLRTTDNREIILPNGALSNGNINNVTKLPVRRVDIDLSVSYGSDAARVKEVVLSLIQANPMFLDGSVEGCADPMVALTQLGDSGIQFVVRAWVKTANYWPARFWLTESIYSQLPKEGITFPFPQMDVHIKD